jgi:chaperonin GroES
MIFFTEIILLLLASSAEAWTSTSSRLPTTLHTRSRLFSAPPPSQYTLDGQDIRGEITPLGNIVLVKVKETLTATSGGILLPDQAKERPTEGVVMSAGPGKIHPFTAVRITNPIEVGMSVLYGKFDGRPVNYNGDECQVIRDDDVLLAYRGVTMKLDNVIPVRDYVLIEIAKQNQDLKTSSGVVVAAQVLKDSVVCEGRVVKVGEGRMASLGNFTPSPVKPGDYVKWKDYAGNEVKIEGKDYSLVKMVDILATLNEEIASD